MFSHNHKIKKHFFVLLYFVFAQNALAEEVPQDWRGVRPAGMGDSFTAVANDENSIFTNPAGIARMRNPRKRNDVHFLTFPEMAVGMNFFGFGEAKTGSGSGASKIDAAIQALALNPGERLFYEASAMPAAVFGGKNTPTFFLGTPFRYTTSMKATSSAVPEIITLKSTRTATAALGIAGTTQRGVLSYGMSVRPNQRHHYVLKDFDVRSASTAALFKETQAQGNVTTGVGVDAGLVMSAPDFWFPTIAVSARNIPTGCITNYVNPVTGYEVAMCGSLRTGAADSVEPEDLIDPTELRAGVSFNPRIKLDREIINVRVHADAYPLPVTGFGLTDIHINKILHAGAELYFGHAVHEPGFAIRAGSNQGYMTYGFSLDVGLSLDYAFYIEDIGDNGEREPEKRHMVSISTHW